MRSILFRGKTTKKEKCEFDNIWVYGNLITCKDKCYIHPKNNSFETNGELGKLFIAHEIIPETVGQFTGLTDKNGKKIFDGDIICALTLDRDTEQKALVGFDSFIDENNSDEYIGFYIQFRGCKTTATQLEMEQVKDRFEVIGNIHDNPELLHEVEE